MPMCVSLRKISVKSSTLHGTRFAFVPCGSCVECRQHYKSEWSFRLSAELESLKKAGWIIAFGTLTYNKQNLPYVPKSCFLKGERYRKIMCFNRSHVRTFIDSLRKEPSLKRSGALLNAVANKVKNDNDSFLYVRQTHNR